MADTNETKGSAMINTLNSELALQEHEQIIAESRSMEEDPVDNNEPPRKKIRAVPVTNTIPFDHAQDSFKVTTSYVKVLMHVFACMSEGGGGGVVGRLQFSNKGLDLSASYNVGTAHIITHLGKEMFASFDCDKDISISLNLQILYKKLHMIYTLDVDSITFQNDGDDLQLIGLGSNNERKGDIIFKGLQHETTADFDLRLLTYDMYITMPSKDFSTHIQNMPDEFALEMDTAQGGLLFTGEEIHTQTRLLLPLSGDVLATVKQHPSVCKYKESFSKFNLSAVKQANNKLNGNVVVGFGAAGMPLFVRYILDDSGADPAQRSQVSIYTSVKCSDNLSDDDYDEY